MSVTALVGCSSSDESAAPQPTVTSNTQSTPEGTVVAFYTAVAAGDLGTACTLTSPELDWPTLTQGTYPTCEAALFTSYTVDNQRDFSDPAVDESKVQVNGENANVPESAVTFDGQPSTDGDNPLILIDGQWYLDVEVE
jgi:hypothetical protein